MHHKSSVPVLRLERARERIGQSKCGSIRVPGCVLFHRSARGLQAHDERERVERRHGGNRERRAVARRSGVDEAISKSIVVVVVLTRARSLSRGDEFQIGRAHV